MKINLAAFRLSEKQLLYASGVFILLTVILRYLHFPLGSPDGGDEPFYVQEADYLAHYGVYKALSQGTSFTYSLLLYLFGKVFSLSHLAAGRVLSVIFFLAGVRLLYLCLNTFTGLNSNVKYMGLLFYATMSASWLWRCLPDIACVAFILAALVLVFSGKSYLRFMWAAVLLFLAFSCKPVALFVLPGLFIYMFFTGLNKSTWMKNSLNLAVFTLVFAVCFGFYHLPGYNTYHRLMLEDKGHSYTNETRVERNISWNEVNNYFLLYKDVHAKQNKWAVSFSEVAEFKQQHPEVKLRMGYTEFLEKHFTVFLQSTAEKFFFYLPYHIQGGLFFAKWTIINKWLKNQTVLYLITFVLIAGVSFSNWKFIRENALLFLIPFLFFATLSFYCISQLEDNWAFFCLPFLALPVLKFMEKYLNISVFFLLQFLYTLILVKNG
jgi:hypothetical protein